MYLEELLRDAPTEKVSAREVEICDVVSLPEAGWPARIVVSKTIMGGSPYFGSVDLDGVPDTVTRAPGADRIVVRHLIDVAEHQYTNRTDALQVVTHHGAEVSLDPGESITYVGVIRPDLFPAATWGHTSSRPHITTG